MGGVEAICVMELDSCLWHPLDLPSHLSTLRFLFRPTQGCCESNLLHTCYSPQREPT
jgi:hypothetical protein